MPTIRVQYIEKNMPQDLLLNEENKEPEQMIIGHMKKLNVVVSNRAKEI